MNWQYWPIVRPLIGLLTSRKFLVVLAAVLAAEFGLDLSPEVQALVYMVGATVVGGGIAYEDGQAKRGNNG